MGEGRGPDIEFSVSSQLPPKLGGLEAQPFTCPLSGTSAELEGGQQPLSVLWDVCLPGRLDWG